MITTYEFPNQWNWRLFIAICSENENLNDILIHLNENEGCLFSINEIHESKFPCFICNNDELNGVICINEYNFTPKDIMYCVHELTHMMINISEVNDCPINNQTTECWAYFMGSMIQMIIEILNFNLQEETKERKKKLKK